MNFLYVRFMQSFIKSIRFKEEIIKRVLSGDKKVIEYLFVEKYLDYLNNEELLISLLGVTEADILITLQKKLNIQFKFVPSICRNLYFNPPVSIKRIERIRKFSIKNRQIYGLEFKFSDIDKLQGNKLYSLKNLKELRFSGTFSLKDFEKSFEIINKIRSINKIFFDYRQAINLSKQQFEKITNLGIDIYSWEGNINITQQIVSNSKQ